MPAVIYPPFAAYDLKTAAPAYGRRGESGTIVDVNGGPVALLALEGGQLEQPVMVNDDGSLPGFSDPNGLAQDGTIRDLFFKSGPNPPMYIWSPQGLKEAAERAQAAAQLAVAPTVEQVNAVVTDTTSAARESLDQAYAGVTALRRAGGGAAIVGDSITSFDANGGDVWHKVLATLSGGRLRHRGFFATGGYTLEQIEAEHLPSALSLTPKPGVVVLAGGTNNTGATGYDAAASRATLLRMIEKCLKVGVLPALWVTPPRGDSSSVNTRVQQWNAWVRYTAQSLGLPLVDAHSALVDPATGTFLAAYDSGDGIHPNRAGHYQIGKLALTEAFRAQFPDATPYLSRSKLDAANLIASGYFFDSGVNGAGIPNGSSGFNNTGNFAASIVPDNAIPGNWWRMAKTTAEGGAIAGIRFDATSGFVEGDRVALAVRVAAQVADSGAEMMAGVRLQPRTNSASLGGSYAYYSGGTFADGVAYIEAVVPPTATVLRVELTSSGAVTADSWVQFAQVTLVNLTALGIA